MYIPPFAAGVLTTIFVMLAVIIIAAYISYRKDKK